MSQRRTRSQIQLVDNPFSFDRSPLKEARAASRIQSQPPEDSDVAMDRDLSSNRVSSANKRSPSPVHPSESNARAKRWKPDQDQNVDLTSLPPTYPRHYSDPNILPLQRKGRKRANTSSKPASAVQPTTRYLSPTTPPKKERARSVPLFSAVPIPAIDFRNPPKSPVRSPSRSPSKEILRIKPVSPIKETHDETEETAAEDSVTSRRVQDVPVDPIRTSSVESSANQADNTHSTSIETTFAMNDQPSTPTQSNAPSLPLSPLTPIPETPSFTRTTTHSNAEDGYTESWDLGPRSNETSKEFATHPQPTPAQEPSGALAKSRLPRPSGPSALKHTSSALLMPPPLPPPVASSSKLAPAHPKVATTASKSTTTASMSQKPVKNAFSLLMSNAKANGKTAVVGGAGASVMAKSMKDKGKGKETPAVLSPPPQTSTSSTRPSVSTSKALKGKGKEKEVSVPPRLAGIKAKMKPREKPKEEAPPKLVFDSDEEEDEEMEQEKDGEDKGEERDRLVLTPTPIEPPVTSPLSPQTDLEPDPMDVVPYVEAETRDVESKGKGKEQEVEAEVEAEAEIEHEKRPELTRQSSIFSQPDIPDEPMVDAPQPDTEPAPDLSLRDSPMSEACSLFDDVDDVLKADYPMVVDGDSASVEVKSMETLPSSVEIAPEPIPAAVAAPILDTAPLPEPETELALASLPLTKPKAKRQPSKKRVPSTFTGTSRVTRSTSSRQKGGIGIEASASSPAPESPTAVPPSKELDFGAEVHVDRSTSSFSAAHPALTQEAETTAFDSVDTTTADDFVDDCASLSSLSELPSDDMPSTSSLPTKAATTKPDSFRGKTKAVSTSKTAKSKSKAPPKHKTSSAGTKAKASILAYTSTPTSTSSFAKPTRSSLAKQSSGTAATTIGDDNATEGDTGTERGNKTKNVTRIPSLPKTPVRPKTPARSMTMSSLIPGGGSKSNPTTPSPTKSKLARTTSMFGTGTSSSSRFPKAADGSALNVLENALEKLRMPPPSRPNTSLGFNRDEGSIADIGSGSTSTGTEAAGKSKDDGSIGTTSGTGMDLGLGHPTGAPKPKSSVAAFGAGSSSSSSSSSSFFKPISSSASTSNFKPSATSNSMFMAVGSGPGLNANKRPGAIMRGTGSGIGGRLGGTINRFPILGSGPRQRVSQQTSLPSVIASPVKGGGGGGGQGDGSMDDSDLEMNGVGHTDGNDTAEANTEDNTMLDPSSFALDSGDESSLFGPSTTTSLSTGKGKEKAKDSESKKKDSFRRASLAHQALSQSLSALPIEKPKEPMGPPPTPPRREGLRNLRSSSSTYPSSSAGGSSSSSVANGNTNSEQKEEKRKYGVLDKCKVFVDIRGEGGEDVASLFSESLEILGARIMTRVGSTCTHIVFKDGLPSTVNRYRLLNDPKPKVVGLTWVVECIEKMQHVDEEKFLIDLEEFKFATAHKRRKSMIPKMIPSFDSSEGGQEGDGDVSMESNSSMLDDLPPLERARLRQSMASRT